MSTLNNLKEKAEKAEIRPYTKKDLALLYNVSTRCFASMIHPFKESIGKKKGWYYSMRQVSIIFERCGIPDDFLPDEFIPENKNPNAETVLKNP